MFDVDDGGSTGLVVGRSICQRKKRCSNNYKWKFTSFCHQSIICSKQLLLDQEEKGYTWKNKT